MEVDGSEAGDACLNEGVYLSRSIFNGTLDTGYSRRIEKAGTEDEGMLIGVKGTKGTGKFKGGKFDSVYLPLRAAIYAAKKALARVCSLSFPRRRGCFFPAGEEGN